MTKPTNIDDALNHLLPMEAVRNGAGSTLSIIPDWVFKTKEYQSEYDALTKRHAFHWLHIPYRQPVPDDAQTQTLAGIKAMRKVSAKLAKLQLAIDTHAAMAEASLQKIDGICA